MREFDYIYVELIDDYSASFLCPLCKKLSIIYRTRLNIRDRWVCDLCRGGYFTEFRTNTFKSICKGILDV